MNKEFKIPVSSPQELTDVKDLVKLFSNLIGKEFKITGKTRTDGSNIRKLIASVLESKRLPQAAIKGQYEIVPPKGKGVPKITENLLILIS